MGKGTGMTQNFARSPLPLSKTFFFFFASRNPTSPPYPIKNERSGLNVWRGMFFEFFVKVCTRRNPHPLSRDCSGKLKHLQTQGRLVTEGECLKYGQWIKTITVVSVFSLLSHCCLYDRLRVILLLTIYFPTLHWLSLIWFRVFPKELQDPSWLNEFTYDRLLVGIAQEVTSQDDPMFWVRLDLFSGKIG